MFYEYASSVSSIVPSVSLFLKTNVMYTMERKFRFFVFSFLIIKDSEKMDEYVNIPNRWSFKEVTSFKEKLCIVIKRHFPLFSKQNIVFPIVLLAGDERNLMVLSLTTCALATEIIFV